MAPRHLSIVSFMSRMIMSKKKKKKKEKMMLSLKTLSVCGFEKRELSLNFVYKILILFMGIMIEHQTYIKSQGSTHWQGVVSASKTL